MEESIIPAPPFDTTSGNWLCLDFTHTLEERVSPQHQEMLQSYSDLVAWGVFVQLLTHEEAQSFLSYAEQHPQQAADTLQRALQIREALYRIFYALAEDDRPDSSDIEFLNKELLEAMSHTRIVPDGNGFKWDWATGTHHLERILWSVVRSAADLLTDDKLTDVRACAAEDCRWLFLDTSKNHSRRWCNMQTCGNQAKARRHYSRKKTIAQ